MLKKYFYILQHLPKFIIKTRIVNMNIKPFSLSWLSNSLILFLLTLTLSSNVMADSAQEAMMGQAVSEEQEDQSVESVPAKEKEAASAPKKEEKPKPVSTRDLAIPQDELRLFLKPFSTDELKVEADGWFKALKKKATEVTALELKATRLNKKQNKIQGSLELLEPAPTQKDESTEEKDPNDPHNLSADERLDYVKNLLVSVDSSIDSDDIESKTDAKKVLSELNKKFDKDKEELSEEIGKEIELRASLVDRLNIVLDSINATDGVKEDGTDNDLVVPLRRYISTVTGLHVDTNDAKSTLKGIKKWIFSKKGGKRWLKNIAMFIGILFGFWILSRIFSAIVNKMLHVSGNTSELLHNFVVGVVKKITMLVGILMSLAALEINVSPILAALGAAGFILAFALQGTISNFASGLLILLYRPFDMGDSIEGGGVSGEVESMNLVSTCIKTPDNQHIVVPNNAIWGGAITNSSSASTRRIDMSFTVSHKDNADDVIKLLENIVKKQSLVLATPAYSVGLNELTDVGMSFNVRPWVNKADYGSVKSVITHEVKRLFDNGKIHMP